MDSPPPAEPYVLADHPALDLLNTVALINGTACDYFQSDADVLRWLARMGVPACVEAGALEEGEVLRSARTLREVVRTLVIRRKAGEAGNYAALNDYLTKCPSYLQLRAVSATGLEVERRAAGLTPESLLAPLAEAAAELLAHGDFSLVKHCEHSDCMLWFYDRTKSHRRRWCSMSLCGNRHKVAEFRKRQAQVTRTGLD